MSVRYFARALSLLLVASGLALASGCEEEPGEAARALASIDESLKLPLPVIPEKVIVPEGNRLAFALPADGVQIYDCKVVGLAAPAWTFRAPEADLSLFGWTVITHYAGPTWEALDGSSVMGTRVDGETVDASAIPWLLLKGGSHQGEGLMARVTYMQRLKTTGGLPPPASSCDTGKLGAVAKVPYTAVYTFYVAR